MNVAKVEGTRMQKRRKRQINNSILRIICIAIIIFVLLCLYFSRDCEDKICYTENQQKKI